MIIFHFTVLKMKHFSTISEKEDNPAMCTKYW